LKATGCPAKLLFQLADLSPSILHFTPVLACFGLVRLPFFGLGPDILRLLTLLL